MGIINLGQEGNPILTRLVNEDKVPWYRKRNLRLLYILLYPTCMGIEITSGFDSQLINGLQLIDSWLSYFGNTSSIVKGKTCVGAVIQGFSVNSAMYIIARMILGSGIIFCIVSGSAMLGELSYPKERPMMTSMFNASYFVGQLVAAGIVVKTSEIATNWGWRIPSLLQCAPSLMQMTFVFLLPESPRYLISKERREEAYDILCHYHAEGDRDSLFAKAELAQIETTIKIELEAAKLSWFDMVRTPVVREYFDFILSWEDLGDDWVY
ncbi:hypothetical protein G7Y89_g14561 [Cudoniella acicularis]|uniref:Major facilitator superfamily (MFS) profile domain-containing protein n=1 Tax=Cudoniella acicularis TaxID=354080 RepID=A0A8H4R1K4_9HELO|nr:hypothetical protein G7Y89_g14561 [Cudoniella acicularis]